MCMNVIYMYAYIHVHVRRHLESKCFTRTYSASYHRGVLVAMGVDFTAIVCKQVSCLGKEVLAVHRRLLYVCIYMYMYIVPDV